MDYEASLSEVRDLCLEYLGERLGLQMTALAKPGFVLKPATDGAPRTGRCQAGGAALLEPGTPWPENRAGVPLSLVAVLDTDEFAPWLGDESPARLGLVNIFSVEPDPQYHGDPRFTETLEQYRKWGNRFDTDVNCQVILADPKHALEIPVPPPASTFERRPLHAAPVITLPSVAGEMADPVLDTFDYRAEPEFDEDDWLPPLERFIQEPFREVWYDYCRTKQGFRNEEGWFRPDQAFGWPYIDSWLMDEKEEEHAHLLTLSGEVLHPNRDGFERVMVPASALKAGEFASATYETDGLH